MAYDNGATVQFQKAFRVDTGGPGATELTGKLRDWMRSRDVLAGILTLTTGAAGASVMVLSEDAAERAAAVGFYETIGPGLPDGAAAAVRAAAAGRSLTVALDGRNDVLLEPGSGLFLVEHAAGGGTRTVVATRAGVVEADE